MPVEYIKPRGGAQAKCMNEHAAWQTKCKKSISRSETGALLGTPKWRGENSISVHNGRNYDTIVKLRDQFNKTMNSMSTHRLPDKGDYSSRRIWRYTLKPAIDKNFRPQSMNIEDF